MSAKNCVSSLILAGAVTTALATIASAELTAPRDLQEFILELETLGLHLLPQILFFPEDRR